MPKANGKLRSLEELSRLKAESSLSGKKLVLCHGVFDLIHVGHIRHLEQARQLGDMLVVTVSPDRYVNKGTHRPAFPEQLRAEALAALACVDYVAINQWPTSVETIHLLRPDLYVKGSDYRTAELDLTGKIDEEQSAVESVGGRLAFTDGITFSSSALLNRHFPIFSTEVVEYLDDFKQKFSSRDVLGYLGEATPLKTLLVGETILDEYVYCDVLGKSAKEPMLAARYLSSEKFAGGILAVANHVASFCDRVDVVTFLGQDPADEAFVRGKLKTNVDPFFLRMSGAPTITKRRFIDEYLLQKLFAIYEMETEAPGSEDRQSLASLLERILPEYDLVVVVDYGHGMLDSSCIGLLSERARFLAVNTQVNAGNKGINSVSKYPRANFVSLTGYEIALEGGDPRKDLDNTITHLAEKIGAEQIMVTLGSRGNIVYCKRSGFCKAPALAQKVVDRVGAGDAVLAVVSLLARLGAAKEIMAFVGNVVGAEAVATMGHRSSIEKVALLKHIDSLVK